MTRPNDEDRKRLIRDLSHLTKILDERVKTLEGSLAKCQTTLGALQRKLRHQQKDQND